MGFQEYASEIHGETRFASARCKKMIFRVLLHGGMIRRGWSFSKQPSFQLRKHRP